MQAVVLVPIKGSDNAWKVADSSDPPEQIQDREVTLLIQSDGAKGYPLIISPTGCFTFDYSLPSMGIDKMLTLD